MEFDEFVEAHLSALGRYAGVLTGDRHLAEDVLSDALITTSSRWDLIGQMEYPLAYVRRIVASAFMADRRRHHRRRTTARRPNRPARSSHQAIRTQDSTTGTSSTGCSAG